MNMFDQILGHVDLDDIAAKFGIPADQVKPLLAAFGAKIAEGGDAEVSAAHAAAQHQLPIEKVNDLLAHLGGKDSLMGKAMSMLDRDGDGNPINELSSLAKGLFG